MATEPEADAQPDEAPDEANILESELARLQTALEASALGVWDWHLASNRVEWSASLERMMGLPVGGFGQTFDDFMQHVGVEDRDRVGEAIQHALSSRGPYRIELRLARADGSVIWGEARGRTLVDSQGRVVGMVGTVMDITNRKEAERAREELLAREQAARADAEAARHRMAYLANLSGELAASLDRERTLARITDSLVPHLADWCVVHELHPDGHIGATALRHTDQNQLEVLQSMVDRAGVDLDDPAGVGRVLRTAIPELSADGPEELFRPRGGRSGTQASIAGGQSTIVVPLVARDHAFAAISMGTARLGRPYDHDDVDLAQHVARRAAAALDNARLYAERVEIAQVLQQSLLPPALPEIPGFELAARYRSARPGLDVGGDFYDVFQIGPNRWGLIIGDVAGKGPAAAAVTATVRHTARAVVNQSDDPGEALRLINDVVIRSRETNRFATAVFAIIEPDRRRLLLAVAGHPLPLLLPNSGSLTTAGHPGQLLGAFPDIDVTTLEMGLESGDLFLAYTDGLTEARREGSFFGEERLRSEMAGCRSCSARETIDLIERALLAFQPDLRDDVALLALRAV